MGIDNKKTGDDDPIAIKTTGGSRFHDPEEMARQMSNAMPGGHYGILPLSKKPFHGEIKVVDFGIGVAMCSASFSSSTNIRVKLARTGNVRFLLPEIIGKNATLNGKSISKNIIHADCTDTFHNLKTSSEHKAGMVLVDMEVMRELMDIHQLTQPCYIKSNTSLPTHSGRISRLNSLLIESTTLLTTSTQHPAWEIKRQILRDSILTELVEITTQSTVKHEHKSHLYQNASMARIDHYIDKHAFGVIELQDLCKETALSLRTVQRTIQSRTGLTAWNYVRRRKLAFVRRALLSPDDTTTVTNTALRFGFLHFGRFSAEYHAAYGELPSTTLHRAKM